MSDGAADSGHTPPAETVAAVDVMAGRLAELLGEPERQWHRDIARNLHDVAAPAIQARWRRAVITNTVTLTRPGFGNGPAHDEHIDVVPVTAFADLLGGES